MHDTGNTWNLWHLNLLKLQVGVCVTLLRNPDPKKDLLNGKKLPVNVQIISGSKRGKPIFTTFNNPQPIKSSVPFTTRCHEYSVLLALALLGCYTVLPDSYWHFETAIDPKTSVTNYQSITCNITDEERPHVDVYFARSVPGHVQHYNVPTGGRSNQKSVKVYALDKYSEHYKKNVVITDLLKTKIK